VAAMAVKYTENCRGGGSLFHCILSTLLHMLVLVVVVVLLRLLALLRAVILDTRRLLVHRGSGRGGQYLCVYGLHC
jgi:hypothetical protein